MIKGFQNKVKGASQGKCKINTCLHGVSRAGGAYSRTQGAGAIISGARHSVTIGVNLSLMFHACYEAAGLIADAYLILVETANAFNALVPHEKLPLHLTLQIHSHMQDPDDLQRFGGYVSVKDDMLSDAKSK